MNRIIVLLSIFLITSLTQQIQAIGNNEQNEQQPLKIGFIMGGPINDLGWNQAHNEGRLYLDKTMHDKVQTIFAENIPENAESARVMEKMIAQGVKVIFLTTYGYLDSGFSVASHHPDVIFMQINRLSNKNLPNLGIYFPYYYEPLYAAGIVAGRMTKSNKIGFIVGHAVSNVLAAVNAFTLGAQSVNPKVNVRLVCTNSWNDPTTETEATKALVENDADIILSNLDSSLKVCRAAAKAGACCIGIHYDLSKQVPKAWLTGQAHNYGALYTKIVEQIMNGSWTPGPKYYTLKDGYTKLASFGQAVPLSVQKEALTVLQKLQNGKLVVFHGPIKDASGKERISKGKIADSTALASMNWVVEGVVGSH